MLILFDIDGTILRTEGAAVQAMIDAGRELFGDHFTLDGIPIAGRLDPLIWADAAALANILDADQHHDRFRKAYGRKLREKIYGTNEAVLCPGVPELITALQKEEFATLGVLTGNYPETGRLKIECAGVDPDVFTVCAWGCDGPTRRDLPPIAMAMNTVMHGRTLQPHQTIIIGDTPHDVDCAHHNGCQCIGVATGQYSVAELTDCGAELVVENLADTETIVQWMREAAGDRQHHLSTNPS